MERKLLELLRRLNSNGHNVAWGRGSCAVSAAIITPDKHNFVARDTYQLIDIIEGWMMAKGYKID